MNAHRTVILAAAVVALAACSNKKDKDDGAASAAPSGSAAPPTTVTPAAPPPPAIEQHVKVELDNRPDGITGTPFGVPGALATLHEPAGWAPTKGDVTVLAAPDKKAQLAVTALTAGDAAAKLPAAATALGLTDCQWGAPEPLVVGKTKLASTGADGVCKRGTAVVHTAYASPTAEKLLVVGAWEDGGDTANVFGAMRSIAKPPTGDPSGLAACCAALRGNAKMAPPEQRQYYLMAASVCDSMRQNPQGRAMIAQLRQQMRGQPMPSSCK
jgi:hypothetical protein